MSKTPEDERFQAEEEKDEVEAHRRHGGGLTEEPKADDESNDDFEAHRKHAG